MKPKAYKIYMDACCFCRPFDDRIQKRVIQEIEAIESILEQSFKAGWTIFSSDALNYEILTPSYSCKSEVLKLYRTSTNEHLRLSETIKKRASALEKAGMRSLDSIHLALAENFGADIFLTTDDRLLAAAKRLKIKLQTSNPTSWLKEIARNDH